MDMAKEEAYKAKLPGRIDCITGIGLISLDGNLSIGIGDGLTLVGGLLFSLHIAYLGMKSGQKDPVLLTIVQFLFAGLWGAGISVFTEDISAIHWTVGQAGSLAYLVIMCTAVAVILSEYRAEPGEFIFRISDPESGVRVRCAFQRDFLW